MLKILTLCVLIAVIGACAPKARTKVTQTREPLNYQEEVIVIELADSIPASAEVLGTLKVGDSGMSTKCNYSQVLAMAKDEARKVGGNAVKITQHKTPDFMSSCHRISAQVLKIESGLLDLLKSIDDEVDPTMDYAMLYVYRNGGPAPLVSYNLYLGDSVICRVNSRFRQEFKIYKTGSMELWAKTESKSSVPIEIKKGKSYYLRCSIAMGIMVGRPSLELLSRQAGMREFSLVNRKSK